MKASGKNRVGGNNSTSPMGIKNRILVAEDEEDTLLGLQKTLSRRGYSVDVARDGLEAAQKVKSRSFDVVISDLKMPKIDGMELLHITKDADKNIAFIIITGYGSVSGAVEAMRVGAFDYINKPFSTDALLGAIEKALQVEKEDISGQKGQPLMANILRRQESEHTWFKIQEDGTVLVGASKEFYEKTGEIVYSDLPFESDKVVKGETCARMIKAREQKPVKLISPVSGTVIKVNDKMMTRPWLAQKDPYGDGWLFAVVPSGLKRELQ